MYPDCDEATAAWAADQLVPTSLRVMREAFPRGGWPAGTASAYIVCTEDLAIVPERARAYAKRLAVQPIELPGSHSLFLSRPDLLADALVNLLDDDAHWSVHP
jgi:pimeloyl-ACP methyl ester carboxylesterase